MSARAASPMDVLQNVLPGRYISRNGRCDLRTCSCFPEAMNHCHRQFHSYRRQCLCFPADHIYCLKWRSLSDTVWQVKDIVCLFWVGRAWCFDWLSLWYEGTYDWSVNCVSSFCRTLYVQGKTSMSLSK
jgi:hypothetical protein